VISIAWKNFTSFREPELDFKITFDDAEGFCGMAASIKILRQNEIEH